MLDDFDSIFKDKDAELQLVLSRKTINSEKMDNVKLLLFAVRSYHDSMTRIKVRFLAFKESADFKDLDSYNKKLVETFDKKINKYLARSESYITKCNEFLNPDEITNDLT